MRRSARLGASLLFVIVSLAMVRTEAQDKTAGAPKPANVCISLDSNYGRINGFLPSTAKFLHKQLPQQRNGIHVVAATVSQHNPAGVARAKGCQYLLQLSLVETNGGRVDFAIGTFTPGGPGG